MRNTGLNLNAHWISQQPSPNRASPKRAPITSIAPVENHEAHSPDRARRLPAESNCRDLQVGGLPNSRKTWNQIQTRLSRQNLPSNPTQNSANLLKSLTCYYSYDYSNPHRYRHGLFCSSPSTPRAIPPNIAWRWAQFSARAVSLIFTSLPSDENSGRSLETRGILRRSWVN